MSKYPKTRGKNTYPLPSTGYHRVCGPGGQCCHYLLVLEEEEHIPPADDDAGGVRLRLHHHQRLHIQPPQDIQEVRVCKPPLPYIFPASKMFFSQKQISFMSSTEDRNTSILYIRGIQKSRDINNQCPLESNWYLRDLRTHSCNQWQIVLSQSVFYLSSSLKFKLHDAICNFEQFIFLCVWT